MIQVGGFIHHHRRIARPAGKHPFAGFGGEFHDPMPTGDGDHVDQRVSHQELSGGDVRFSDGGDAVGRTACGDNCLIEIFDHPSGDNFGFRMGVVDHRVAAGQHHDAVVNNARCGVGDRVDGGDHSHRDSFIDGDTPITGENLRLQILHRRHAAGGFQFQHRACGSSQIGFLQFHAAVFFAVGPAGIPDRLDDFFADGQRQLHQLPMGGNSRLDGIFHLLEDAVGVVRRSPGTRASGGSG